MTNNCLYCSSEKVQKNGHLKGGGQRFKCRECHKSFTSGGLRGTYTQEFKETVVEKYCHEKVSARTMIKNYHISSTTLVSWGKHHKEDCDQCNEGLKSNSASGRK